MAELNRDKVYQKQMEKINIHVHWGDMVKRTHGMEDALHFLV